MKILKEISKKFKKLIGGKSSHVSKTVKKNWKLDRMYSSQESHEKAYYPKRKNTPKKHPKTK